MTIPPKLSYAILSLDSYNRGYDPGIVGLGGVGTSVGSATIVMQSPTDPASPEFAASFYAVAYQTTDGLVISYRGTGDIPAAMQAGGTTGAGLLRSQARRAARSALPAEH
jgi:hypothetical protein